MRRKSHLKLSVVVQKSLDSSTNVIPSLHFVSLIAVRDPWTARVSQAQCDFAFIWPYFFRFGIQNCLTTMSLLILGRAGGRGGGGGVVDATKGKSVSKYCNISKTPGSGSIHPPFPLPCTTVGVWICLYVRGWRYSDAIQTLFSLKSSLGAFFDFQATLKRRLEIQREANNEEEDDNKKPRRWKAERYGC